MNVNRTGEGRLNVKQRRSLARYLGSIAPHLGLSDWDIFLSDEPCEDPSYAATVTCTPGRKKAHIQVSADFFDMDPVEQRQVLVHELVHVHTDREFQLIEDTLPQMIGSIAYHPFEKAYRSLHEHATDALAAVIAPHFPVP